MSKFYAKTLEADPGYTVEETLENRITILLSKIREEAAAIIDKYVDKDSDAYIMAKTGGARGSLVNLTQMMALLGQQTVRGERFKRGLPQQNASSLRAGRPGTRGEGLRQVQSEAWINPPNRVLLPRGERQGWIGGYRGQDVAERLRPA